MLTTIEPAKVSEELMLLYKKVLQDADALQWLGQADENILHKTAPKISKWSVFKHVAHLALTGNQMIEAIEGILKKPIENRNKRSTLLAQIVLWTGHIPRGKGEAPPEMTAGESMNTDSLQKMLGHFYAKVCRLEKHLTELGQVKGRSPHPVFGYFTSEQWLRMLEVHYRHHLKIIQDIKKHGADDKK